jgi:hypothetical protein
MTARRNPVKAPRNPSVIERRLKLRGPWPVRRNPVYAIVSVHKVTRTLIGHLTALGGTPNLVTKCFTAGKISLGQLEV